MTSPPTHRNVARIRASPETMTVGLGLALALIVSIGPDAEPRLEWDAPLECPDQRWVEDRVGAYLGYPLGDESDVHVRGQVRAQGAGFVLDLSTEAGGVHERQELRHHECLALVELAASLAAISIDPLARGREREPEPAPELPVGVEVQRPLATTPLSTPAPLFTPAPPPRSPPQPPPKPVKPQPEPLLGELYADPNYDERDIDPPEPDQPPRTQVSIGASAGLALELFPNAAPEVHANLGVSRGGARAAFRAELLGGAILAGRFRSEDGTTGGNLLAWDLGLRPCGVPRWGIVELRACAAVGAGQIRARGVNVEPDLPRAHPWVWLAPELGLAVAVSRRVALFVDVGANFNLYRPRFEIRNTDVEFVTPVASARTRLGVELRFR